MHDSRLEPTALTLKFSKLFSCLTCAALVSCSGITSAQDLFREPTSIPARVPTTAQAPAELRSNEFAAGQSDSKAATDPSTPEFVPPSAPETRLRPIVPRGIGQVFQDGSNFQNSETSQNLPNNLQPNASSILSGQFEANSGYGDLSPITPGRTDLRSIVEGSFQAEEETLSRNSGPEVITQRYPNGKPQLIKQVAQDEEGNYYDHGDWKVLNLEGDVLARGQFNQGVMDGVWMRLHPPNSGGIFATRPFNLFRGPFTSTASFSEGNLDGIWTLQDAFERKIFEIPYRQGVRHGTATWWYPNAVTMREVTFKGGVIDGPLREWDDQNKLTRYEEFIEGKKIIRHTTFYRPQQRQEENFYLDGKLELAGDDDWWKAQPASFRVTTPRIQHGPALAWYDNDQPKMKGQYRNNARVGRFTWWHPNGQKALEGNYDDDGQKIGEWTWWHTNGIKSIQGSYDKDVPTGGWTWWETDGQVKTKEEMDDRQPESTEKIQQNPLIEDPSKSDIGDSAPTLLEDFDALEEIEPYGEDSIDILPGKLAPAENSPDSDAADGGNL